MSEELQAIKEIHDKVKDQVSLEDFRARIGQKVSEHYGLLSEVGAAKLLAREMGATFKAPDVSLRIRSLVPGMQSVDVAGRVVRIYGVRSFDRESGSGKVCNLLMMDETGDVRVVLWGEKAEPVERNAIKRGDIVQIRSGYTRTGLSGDVEVHVGRRGRIIVNPAVSEPMAELKVTRTKISEIKEGMREVETEGVVSGVSNVRTFSRADGSVGRVATVFLRDETGEIRVSLWNEKTEGLNAIQKGSAISIAGAYVRPGFNGGVELQCSSSSEITVKPGKADRLPEIEKSTVPLNDLQDGMQSIDIAVRVQRVLGRRTFTRLNGQEGKVANLIVDDGTASARLVLWGDTADMMSRLVEGSRLLVENAYTKIGLNQEMEVHVGWRGRVVIEVEEFKPMGCDIERGMENLDLQVGIVEVGLPEEFEDAKLVSTVVGDSTGTVPAVFWDGHVDPVADLEPSTTIRITNAKVNDLGEVQVLPESSLEVLDGKTQVLQEQEPANTTIAELKPGRLSRIRAAPVAVTDLRLTSSFGREKLLCSCRVDDGSAQAPVTVFGLKASKLVRDAGDDEDLRSRFIKGADAVFTGVVVDGRLRVVEVERPDPREEIAKAIRDLEEAS